ncbi:T3SS effector HopA1 family protein [Streptomyces sparsogenes]|uniref:T3SS effector HopA1 family protein n=1 Tax=Streptomyces sparsogenes TaxID=67365 RepID=UPI0033CC988E
MTGTAEPAGPGPLSPAVRAALTHLRLCGTRADGTPDIRLEGLRVPGDTVREVRQALAAALYERWHAGTAREPDAPVLPPRRDHAFEARLFGATPHAHTLAEAVVRTPPAPGGGRLTAELGRVRVSLPPDAVRGGPGGGPPGAGARVVVELPAVRPTLSPGFWLVDGADGRPADGAGRELLRMYVHLRYADAAPRVWGVLLAELAARSVPYRAKVLSRPWAYPRRDALVVYLDADRADAVFPLAAAVRRLPGVGADTSVFARRLIPGVAVAWEPRDARPGRHGQSFGQHRAAAVAEGVVRHAADRERTDLAREVAASLHRAGADPAEPARNHSSPGLPTSALLTSRQASRPLP